MDSHTPIPKDDVTFNKGIATLSFRSYTVSFSIPLKALFSQMKDGTVPLNKLFAIDLPRGIVYQIKIQLFY